MIPRPLDAVGDRIAGAVALVTGASAGIGAAAARALIAAGATVVAVDRDNPTVDGVDAIVADLVDGAGGLVEEAVQRHGRLDFVINNAGLARHAAVTQIDLAEVDLMFAINVRALIELTRDAMRAMATSGGGRIVNVISTAALAGQPGESAYCATKFAVRGFTEAAAEEGRLVGVRVTGVYPAGVQTAFWEAAVGHPREFTGDKHWLPPDVVASQLVSVLRLPLDVDVPTIVIRHPGDADLSAIGAKLDRIRRS